MQEIKIFYHSRKLNRNINSRETFNNLTIIHFYKKPRSKGCKINE